MRLHFALASCVAAVVSSGHSCADAATVFYTDVSSFDSAATTTLVEDFEATGQLLNTQIFPGFTNSGITYTGLAGTPSPNVVIADGLSNFGLVGVIPSRVLTANGLEDFTVDFGSPVTAVGFDTYLNAATVLDMTSPDTVRVYGASGILGSFNPTHAATSIGFLGVTSDEPIVSVRWSTVGGEVINTGIDNVVQGSAIPEPTSLALYALLAGSSLLARGRKTLS